MPTIIDYPQVLSTLEGAGLACNYHNSGAFAFARGVAAQVAAYIGPEDPTIRPSAMEFVRRVRPPYADHLASHALRFWEEQLRGPAWLMPVSHWAYELEFGNAQWLPAAIEGLGLDPGMLRPRNNGSAIALQRGEGKTLERFMQTLLANLAGSDFTLAFPENGQLVCTVHHHQQMWWVCGDRSYVEQLDGLAKRMSILDCPAAP